MLPSCDTKDDELWDRVDELFERVEKLEDACTQMNTDIHSIQSVLSAIQNNYSITSVTPLDGEEGYTITFSNGEKITINHGKNGADGKDGNTPTISIKDMGNGQYAWLVNGELLRDAQGNPIPVNGKDGEDGKDGADGEDGEDGKDGYNGSSAPTPIVKTGSELISSGINGSWDRGAVYISVNGGSSWTQISSSNGGSIFASVNTSNVGYITFTLTNGIKFTVPRADDLASLILGEWYYYNSNLDGIYHFNSDGTYSRNNPDGSNDRIGTYELEGGNYILFYPNAAWDFMTIISCNDYLMKWGTRDYVYYLYRPNAFIFDKTEINAPQEGGTFTIQVDAKFPFQVSDDYPYNGPNVSNNSTNIYSSTNDNSTLSFTPSVTKNSIVVEIAPNMSNLNLSAEFYIEDTYGNRLTTITINQEKNTEVASGEVKLSEWGKNSVDRLFEMVGGFSGELANMGWDYTSGGNPNFKPRLSPDNETLSYAWSETYRGINDINKTLKQAEQELSNGPLKAPLEILRAILYYNLAVYWGNVSYVTEANLDNIYSAQQLSTTQLFEKLIPQLKSAIDVLEERRTPIDTDDYFLSKDVARMVLAQIYMYQGKYEEAEKLFQKIKDNDFYNYQGGNEFILSRVYHYTNLLLGLAECKLNGNTPNTADPFINEVSNSFGYHYDIENSDKMQIMKDIYVRFVPHHLGYRSDYFAFLKRNGLAKETIGITEDYQLLFPIPQSEINLNPNMAQNPGY